MENDAEEKIMGNVGYENDTYQVTVTMLENFEVDSNRKYYICISTVIEDLSGNKLAAEYRENIFSDIRFSIYR